MNTVAAIFAAFWAMAIVVGLLMVAGLWVVFDSMAKWIRVWFKK